ncbi:MAG: hypothetical protein M1305_04365, partial [Candidatus Marsarchaeota archaeon]|nr:hypothetical protein [Candidatus Marsarchaeota archaeon]
WVPSAVGIIIQLAGGLRPATEVAGYVYEVRLRGLVVANLFAKRCSMLRAHPSPGAPEADVRSAGAIGQAGALS